jgi:hypothetical protein
VNLQHVEQIIGDYSLVFPQVRSPEVEYASFPPMVSIYWRLADALKGSPPTQQAFAETIVALVEQTQPALPTVAVHARACRAYPSLVRQHHAELWLREAFDPVVREDRLDYNGIDFLIVDAGEAFGLGLSVDTARARAWQAIKRERHPPPVGLPILDLAPTPDYQVGRFWLHAPTQAEEVRAFIARERAGRQWAQWQQFVESLRRLVDVDLDAIA